MERRFRNLRSFSLSRHEPVALSQGSPRSGCAPTDRLVYQAPIRFPQSSLPTGMAGFRIRLPRSRGQFLSPEQRKEFLAQAKGERMAGLMGKSPRLRLDTRTYKQLRRQVLERDGWRCQSCGGLSNLQVHHSRTRGHLGDDREENLITLCESCHQEVHYRKRSI